MSDLITDEMVETSADAQWRYEWPIREFHREPDDLKDFYRNSARAALEVAAPLIAAKVLNDTADEFSARLSDGTGYGRAYNSYSVAWLLRTRAQTTLETGATND